MSVTAAVKIAVLAAAAALPLVAGSTGANAYGENQINRNEAREAAAIEQGRRNGQLTRREYRDLQAEQRAIRDMEARAKSDGYVSPREYRNIVEAQRNAARHIYQERTDNQSNWFRRWYSSRY